MKLPYLVLTSLLLFCGHAYSQKVDVIRKSDTFASKGKQHDFIYWNNPADTAGLEYVATLSAQPKGELRSLWALWEGISYSSGKLGANAFILRSFTESDSTKSELILDVYFADTTIIPRNTDREEKNAVYLFGNKGKPMPLKVNGEEVKIPADSFLRYELPEGTTLKVSKGSALGGSSGRIRGEAGRVALYYSVSGFGLGGAVPPPGTVGLSFNTGRITPLNPHFARMMMDTQKK